VTLAVGCPLGNDREKTLGHWLAALEAQTVQPDYARFVVSRGFSPDTGALLRAHFQDCRIRVAGGTLFGAPFYSRTERNGDQKDPCRAGHFTRLRNCLRSQFLQTDADVFLSLDSDVLLEDPRTIERLLKTLDAGWDITAPRLSLHPSLDTVYNAGFWLADAAPDDPQAFRRIWQRADENVVRAYKSPVRIDVPMACYAIRRHAMGMCAYKAHESGEDLGFADSLARYKMRVAWLTDLPARHVWSPDYL
jgi:hypothetical protein